MFITKCIELFKQGQFIVLKDVFNLKSGYSFNYREIMLNNFYYKNLIVCLRNKL